MKQINVAVVGLGYWGPNIVRNLLKIPNVSQVYGCDIQKDKLDSIKKSFPNVRTTNKFDSLLKQEDLDAVIIATPINSHFRLAFKALHAGKHTLIEKPMTSSSQEARRLIKLAKRVRKTLMVGHTFVYSQAIRKIKKIIQNKELGKAYYYESTRINLGIIQSDSNVIWDLAPHDLSIINYLFPQKIISAQAFGSCFIGRDYELAHIFLTFKNNFSVHMNISWLSPVKIRSILIGGSKKMIAYDDIEPSEKIKIYDKGIIPPKSSITPFTPAYRSGDITIPRLDQTEALSTELYHFVDCILNHKNPNTSGADGLKVILALEAIEKAISSNKKILL